MAKSKTSDTATSAKTRAQLRKEQLILQHEQEWLEDSKSWPQRASEVLQFLMEEVNPGQYSCKVLTNPPLKGLPAFEVKETGCYDTKILYLMPPDVSTPLEFRHDALSDLYCLERFKAHELEIRAENKRRDDVRQGALIRISETFSEEEIELIGLKAEVSNAVFRKKTQR